MFIHILYTEKYLIYLHLIFCIFLCAGDKLLTNRSPERSRIQPGYSLIDKYTSKYTSIPPLILVYKTCTINKNAANIEGAVNTMPAFYFGFE